MAVEKVNDSEFLIVLPSCGKDSWLTIKNLEYWIRLSQKTRFDGLLTYDESVPQAHVQKLLELGEHFFHRFFLNEYPLIENAPWPIPQNASFQETARYIEFVFSGGKTPWFWVESDATPLRPDWLDLFWAEYKRGGKPFMGHKVAGMGHMNGVGVYPNSVSQYSSGAMTAVKSAWDVAMSQQIMPDFFHNANHLIQHMWTASPAEEMKAWSKAGVVTFPDKESMIRLDFRCALHHRSKDGTLIDRLIEHYWGDKTTSQVNVPQHTPKLEVVEHKAKPAGEPVVEILISTYIKDLPWLKYCIEALQKFATGFNGITLIVPHHKSEKFLPLVRGGPMKVKLKTYDEVKGKGMLHHMVMIFNADKVIPPNATHVMHLDPDCIYHSPVTPHSYFTDGLPHYVVRTYASLTDPKSQVVSDCMQWQEVVKKALGYLPEWYSMCRHPTVFPVCLYEPLRDYITQATGTNCDDFILSQRNEFPQTFAEFPTMGGWAWEKAREHFMWIDASQGLAPVDKQKAYWSHAGLNQIMEGGKTAKAEIEGFLR